MDALSAQDTRRVATPDTVNITQDLVTESIRTAFSGDLDTTVKRWVPAHADLNWANVTAPTFCLFDREDWESHRGGSTRHRCGEAPSPSRLWLIAYGKSGAMTSRAGTAS